MIRAIISHLERAALSKLLRNLYFSAPDNNQIHLLVKNNLYKQLNFFYLLIFKILPETYQSEIIRFIETNIQQINQVLSNNILDLSDPETRFYFNQKKVSVLNTHRVIFNTIYKINVNAFIQEFFPRSYYAIINLIGDELLFIDLTKIKTHNQQQTLARTLADWRARHHQRNLNFEDPFPTPDLLPFFTEIQENPDVIIGGNKQSRIKRTNNIKWYLQQKEQFDLIINHFHPNLDKSSKKIIYTKIKPYHNDFIDIPFFIFLLLLPQQKKSVDLIKILSYAPEAINSTSFKDNYHLFNIIGSTTKIYTNEMFFQFLFDLSGDSLQINNSHVQELQSLINNIFIKYNYNQISRLFASRNGYSIYFILVLNCLFNKRSITLDVESNLLDLTKYLLPNKKLNNPSLKNINNNESDVFKFKVLESILEYEDASKIFKNCVLNYYHKQHDDIIIVFDKVQQNKPIACISIKNKKIDQFLGISNKIVSEDYKIKIIPIILQYL